MHSYAQTNIQLFNQLRDDGYSLEDLRALRHAYEFARQIFPCRVRPSGKMTLHHLVGTASILTSLRVSQEIVIAGLLHAAYPAGDFGSVSNLSLRAKRKQLKRALGAEVEELVAAYTALPWTTQAILDMHRNFAALSALERNVLLIRLTNDLEDNLDLGVLYCQNRERRLRLLQCCGPAMTDMARLLGYPALAGELAQSHEVMVCMRNLDAFPLMTNYSSDWVLPPQSCRKRLPALLTESVMYQSRRVFNKVKNLSRQLHK